MNELERLRRAYDTIDEPTQAAVAKARERLLAEIASLQLPGSAENGHARLAPHHKRRPAGRTRRVLVGVAALLAVAGLLVVPGIGVGSRILDLLEPPGVRPPAQVSPVWSPDGR